MSIDITIHSVGMGQCALTGKEAEGMTVTIKDGTLKEGFLAQKAFFQLLKMKLGQKPEALKQEATKHEARMPAAVPANGPAMAK